MRHQCAFAGATALLLLLMLTTGECALDVRFQQPQHHDEVTHNSWPIQINSDEAKVPTRSLRGMTRENPSDTLAGFTLPTLSSDISFSTGIVQTMEIDSYNAADNAAESGATGAEPRKAIHRTFPGTDDDGDSDNDETSSSSRRSLTTTFKGPIRYHGGQLMTGQVNVYILYINYDKHSLAPAWINYMVDNLQGSPWWRTVTRYYSTVGGTTSYVSGDIKLANFTFLTVPSSQYLDLTDIAPVGNFAAYAISKKWVPDDKANGIYVVIPAKSRNIVLQGGRDGFCGSKGYCGWHSVHAGIKIALIPQADCEGCYYYQQSITRKGKYSPSTDPAVDAMCSTVAHELAETVTDPDTVKGWMDNSGNENADMCVASFGTSYATNFALGGKSRKVYYNTLLGPENIPFILQQNWDPVFRPDSNKQFGCTSGIYQISSLRSNSSSNKCLDVPGDNQVEGQALSAAVCNDTAISQLFDLVPSGSGYYIFRTYTNLCVGIKDDSTVAGSDVTLQLCNNTDTAQQFGFFGNEAYEIKPRNAIADDMCIRLAGGAKIQISACSGSPSQLFIPSSSVNTVQA